MTLSPSARRRLAPMITALTLSLAVGGTGQAQTADDIHAGILTSLGLGDAASSDLSADHQAGLADFMARARVFADDLGRALRAETIPDGRSPREAAENPSLTELHALLSDMDPEQLINLITGYTPQDDTTDALLSAFAPVLPAHLGTRRAELEAEFGPRMLGALRNTDLPHYLNIQERDGLYIAFRSLLTERSGEFETRMAEPAFFSLLHDIYQEERASTYDEVRHFDMGLAGLYDRLMRGEGNINRSMYEIFVPVMTEDHARLHSGLWDIYTSSVEAERVRAERERVRAERERVRAERARLEELVAAREETLRILGLSVAED